jgi:hypothetical protein
MRFYTREFEKGALDADARAEVHRAFEEHVDRLRPSLPPALTLLTAGGGVFGFHDASLLALDDEAGQVAITLRFFDTDEDAERAELTVRYAGARLMGITDEERVEILDPDGRTHDWDGLGGIPAGEAWIMGDELDRWADGRFVHRFSLSWPWYEEFAIEFADVGVWLKALSGRRLDLSQPEEALAAVEEKVALCRERVAGNPDPSSGLAWLLNDLSGRLAGLGRPDEALAAIEEAVALYRQVAASDPEVMHDLAGSLNNLASRLAALGRPDEALAANEEAAALVP